mmetsp:Transcript_64804/g.200671  ORF Transcript_64804/g.200671 Transcript_64804/m.200671 type:complete len:268 (-) Transcript_64804:940-1743(-)
MPPGEGGRAERAPRRPVPPRAGGAALAGGEPSCPEPRERRTGSEEEQPFLRRVHHSSALGGSFSKAESTMASWLLERCLGKRTSTLTNRSPKLAGSSRRGIPSPLTLITWKERVMPWEDTSTVWPSRCRMVLVHPRRASRRLTCVARCRSSPLRSNLWCFCSWSVRMTLPGSMPGRSSAILGKLSFSLCFMPFSIWTSIVVSSLLHFSLLGTSCCCCMNMPGPTCTCTFFTSLGHREQPRHLGESGFARQPLQTTRRCKPAFCRPPL